MNKGVITDKDTYMVNPLATRLKKNKISRLEVIFAYSIPYCRHLFRRAGKMHIEYFVIHETHKT